MSEWNKYQHLEKADSDYNRLRDESKFADDPQAQLLAESGALIDGITLEKYFEVQDMVKKIMAAHKIYKFTKQPACEVINIGGVDYKLADYGLADTFSENVDILIPWLCICKKIKKANIEVEMRLEEREVHG